MQTITAFRATLSDVLPTGNDVETVVQLSKGNEPGQNVKLEFSLEDMDMSGSRQGATYE